MPASEFAALVDSSATDPVSAIMEITGGRGATAAFESSGAPSARVGDTLPWTVGTRRVGRVGGITLDVSPDIVLKQISIIGSYTFSNVGLGECARVVAAHGIEVDSLFTARWSIEEADAAHKEFDKQVRGKAVIEL
jgi:(R,R)-butanediol dehydrogenase / meso-butanediol dehydrogenase / diacetyl reductase